MPLILFISGSSARFCCLSCFASWQVLDAARFIHSSIFYHYYKGGVMQEITIGELEIALHDLLRECEYSQAVRELIDLFEMRRDALKARYSRVTHLPSSALFELLPEGGGDAH